MINTQDLNGFPFAYAGAPDAPALSVSGRCLPRS